MASHPPMFVIVVRNHSVIYLNTVSWCFMGSIKINDVLRTKSGNKLKYDNGIENVNMQVIKWFLGNLLVPIVF